MTIRKPADGRNSAEGGLQGEVGLVAVIVVLHHDRDHISAKRSQHFLGHSRLLLPLLLPLLPATPIINGWKAIVFMPNHAGTTTERTGTGQLVEPALGQTCKLADAQVVMISDTACQI